MRGARGVGRLWREGVRRGIGFDEWCAGRTPGWLGPSRSARPGRVARGSDSSGSTSGALVARLAGWDLRGVPGRGVWRGIGFDEWRAGRTPGWLGPLPRDRPGRVAGRQHTNWATTHSTTVGGVREGCAPPLRGCHEPAHTPSGWCVWHTMPSVRTPHAGWYSCGEDVCASDPGWIDPAVCTRGDSLRESAEVHMAGRPARKAGKLSARPSQPPRHVSRCAAWGPALLGRCGGQGIC